MVTDAEIREAFRLKCVMAEGREAMGQYLYIRNRLREDFLLHQTLGHNEPWMREASGIVARFHTRTYKEQFIPEHVVPGRLIPAKVEHALYLKLLEF